MKVSEIFISLAACCIICSAVGELSIYCVTSNQSSNNSSNSLCDESSCKVCRGLESYVNGTEALHDNSQLVFCPGIHTLSRPWNISNVSNLTISTTDPGSTTIHCTSPQYGGLHFENVSELTITGIRMNKCSASKNLYYDIITMSALIFHRGKHLTLQDLNIIESSGGSIAVVDVTGDISISNSLFADARIKNGHKILSGNIIAYNSFDGNGATMRVSDTNITGNKYESLTCKSWKDLRLSAGLAVVVKRSNVSIFFSHITLSGNEGCAGGNMAIIYFDLYRLVNNTRISIGNDSKIECGWGNVGGGMFITMVNSNSSKENPPDGGAAAWDLDDTLPVLNISNTTFKQNKVKFVGGGIYLKQLETYHFSHAGVVAIEDCHFENNTGAGGLAIHFTTFVIREYKSHDRPQVKVFVYQCSFTKHTVTGKHQQLQVELGTAVIFVKTSPFFGIDGVRIENNSCTGLLGITSNFVISNSVNITRNRAYKGGGILLCSGAVLFFKNQTTLNISDNRANHTGGGIAVENECVINRPRCFFQLDSNVQNHTQQHIRVIVKDNKATYAGDNIYGGSIRTCYSIATTSEQKANIFHQLFEVDENNFTKKYNSSVSSQPEQVCLVNQHKHTHTLINNCTSYEVDIYPGQSITVQAVVRGQMGGLVPGTVSARIEHNGKRKNVFLGKSDRLKKVPTLSVQKLIYRIFSKKENITAKLQLTAEGTEAERGTHIFEVLLNIKPCPVGYELSYPRSTQTRCTCDKLREIMNKNHLRCSISRQVGIQYQPPIWIGLIEDSSGSGENTEQFAASYTCPRDYCNLTHKRFLSLKNLTVESKAQCYFDRMGVLCGHCPNESSLILGSSECSFGCSNYYLFLLVVFAMAGVTLVAFINLLNMTVTVGTINGLIFYANIVQIYSFFLFEQNSSPLAQFLRIFLSWLNLDFGFKVCFFKGMDGLYKALLQFVFPLYIWMLAGIIIYLSRISSRVASLLGRNSVQVLATLILLSYSKILRAAMDALHFTRLLVPTTGRITLHWTMDGNHRYLEGKHVWIFVVGVVFAVASLPFMATLLCVQHTGRVSHWRLFSWVDRLKPFFDSYTGPLQDRARFWVGLLLFSRILILCLRSFNTADSDVVVMAMILLICLVLLFISFVIPKGVYRTHWLNVLENFFIVKLAVLFLGLICSIYYKNEKLRSYLVNTSIALACLLFVLIVVFHALVKVRCLPKFKNAVKMRRIRQRSHPHADDHNQMGYPPYHGFDSDREPLLAEVY